MLQSPYLKVSKVPRMPLVSEWKVGGFLWIPWKPLGAECPVPERSPLLYVLPLTLMRAWIPSSRSFSFSYTLSEVPKTRLFVNTLLRCCIGLSQDWMRSSENRSSSVS